VRAVPRLCEFFTLAFALQLREKHGKTTVRVRETSVRLIKTSVRVQYTYYQDSHTLQNPHIRTHTHTHKHTLTPTITKQYKKPPQYNLKQTQYKIYPNEIKQYPIWNSSGCYLLGPSGHWPLASTPATVSLLRLRPGRLEYPLSLLFGGYQWKGDRGVKLTTYLHLVPKLRMNGSIPLLPLYVSMARVGTPLPLYLLMIRLGHCIHFALYPLLTHYRRKRLLLNTVSVDKRAVKTECDGRTDQRQYWELLLTVNSCRHCSIDRSM
jgi:hypothetical protein